MKKNNSNRRAFGKSKLLALAISSALLAGCGSDDDSPSTPGGSSSLQIAITASQYAAINTAITLSAKGSSTTNGSTLTYQWQVIDEPATDASRILTPSARNTRFIATTEGNYTIKLTVSDGESTLSTTKVIYVDLDGDGIPSTEDFDIDGDGVANTDDAFPNDKTEWVDSDGDGVGNYAQLDEDGDGIDDLDDAYPFDSTQQDLYTYPELEFNGNLYPDGNQLKRSYPFQVTGSISSGTGYDVDTDYFVFEANAGDIITILLHKTDPNFEPTLALLTNDGDSLPTVKVDWQDTDYLVVSSRITSDGDYAFSVADTNNNVSDDFTYEVKVFKDSDMDGISDDRELAFGMQPTNPDTDGDGILDGLEQHLSQNDMDQDGDSLPSWWDLDSDGDFIEDSLEGVLDIDGDGIPNFLDTDSDGNGITDDIEVGTDPTQPLDTDKDGVLDFADTDDDNDGILDINDTDRLVPIAQAELNDQDNRLVISDLSVVINSSNQTIDKLARVGDTIRIEGEGFDADSVIIWDQGTELLNFIPTVEDSDTLSFVVPDNAQSGSIKVTNGDKITYPQQVTIVDADNPLIFDVVTNDGTDYAYAGSSITIEGINLTASDTSVNLNGVALVPTKISSTSVQVTLPDDAASGVIAVVANGVSNWLDIEVRQPTAGNVVLPTNSTLTYDQLTVQLLSSQSSAVDTNGSFALPTLNQSATSVYIYAPQIAGKDPAIYLSSVILPGQTDVTISPYTMAAGLAYTAMGLQATIHSDDQIAAMDILLAATKDFGDYLNEKLGQDPYYLEDYQRTDFVDEYVSAIESAGKAIDAAIADGTLREQTVSQANNNVNLRSNTGGELSVTPASMQSDFGVTLDTEDGEATGKIEMENDTMMYADYQITDAYSDQVIRKFVNAYFSSDLFGPQSGFFQLYNANVIDEDVGFKTTDLRIYTPGIKDMDWDNYIRTPSYKLAIRTFITQGLAPFINTVIGTKLADTNTEKVVELLAKAHIFDAADEGWKKGTEAGFLEGLQAMIVAIDISLWEEIAKLYVEDNLVQTTAGAIALNSLPWVKAASIGGTAVDLSKLATDIATTESQLDFRINFPITVESIAPSVILVDGERKEVALTGRGLDPVNKSNFFGSSDTYIPKVTFTDSEGKEYTDENPTYDQYLVQPGYTAPISPLKTHLSAQYLDDAVSPLSITVQHYLLDEGVFSDDLIDVTLDTDFQVTLVTSLTISGLEPSSGGWGDIVKISGAGFSSDITNNSVYFTDEDGQPLAAMVTNATATELTVAVPRGAVTGSVWVEVMKNNTQSSKSNTLPFELNQQAYTFKFGDNGNLNDDTYALYVDGQLILTMASPSRAVYADVQLTTGSHQVELHGITAPDAVGTYYITFPTGITLVSGDSTSGTDLTAGEVKYYNVTVEAPTSTRARTKSFDQPIDIIWKE